MLTPPDVWRSQEIPSPEALGSPLPGGIARVVRFFLDFPQPLQIGGLVVAVVAAAVGAVWIWRRRARIRAWLTTQPRIVYAGMVGGGVLLALIGASAGVLGLHYVEHDNGFCTGCHVMGPAFVRFTESEHSQLECHDCHRQPMTASLRQLYLWVAERPREIGPHAPVPAAVCAECHVREDAREPWEAVAATQGHRTHLTSDSAALAGVGCVTCHGREVHRFVPAEETCAQSGCHAAEQTRFALGPMSGDQTSFHCLACHEFTAPADATGGPGDAGFVPGIDACGACHAMEPIVADIMPSTDPHLARCGSCHDPHAQTGPKDAFQTCTSAGCHANPASLTPFHRSVLHHAVLDDCSKCHAAHTWVVDGEDCRSCHTNLSE